MAEPVTAPGLGAIHFDPSVSPDEQKLIQEKLGVQPQAQFKYVPLPNGSYGKFKADATDEQIQAAISKYSATQKPQAPTTQKESLGKRLVEGVVEQGIPPFLRGETAKNIASKVGPAIIPTLATAAGGYFGGMPGEALGGGAGEAINQFLGISEPSKAAIVGSAAAGPIGRGLGAGIEKGVGTIAKTFAGRDIMSQAAESLLQKMMSPPRSAAELYKEAGELNFFVPAVRTPQALENVLENEVKLAPTKIQQEIIDAVKPLRDYFMPSRGDINAIHAPDLMKDAARLRKLATDAFKNDNSDLGIALSGVRNAMLDDLEQSGAGVVKEAARAYRKESALEDLATLMGKPHPLQKIADYMKKDSLFNGAFNAQEKAQIDRIAKKMLHVPASGGTGIWGKVATGALGELVGGEVGAGIGFFTPNMIKAIMETQFGRNYAERLLSGTPIVNRDALAAVGAFARGMTAKAPEQQNAQ